MFWFVFLLTLFTSSVVSQSTDLPTTLGTLKLTHQLHGKEAQSFLNRLHDKEIAPKTSVMGRYRDGKYEASLYVSVFVSRSAAVEAFGQMTRLIRVGNRVFTQYKQLSKEKASAGRCEGLGQTHFFFSQRNQVYWLGADPRVAEDSFQALLGFLEKASGSS